MYDGHSRPFLGHRPIPCILRIVLPIVLPVFDCPLLVLDITWRSLTEVEGKRVLLGGHPLERVVG